jgi:hypothetical protein
VPASSVGNLSCQWVAQLAHFRRHRNDEHREALIEEAARYAGFHLEDHLESVPYWSEAPLARRVAVLLFLVDRGVVRRRVRNGQTRFEPAPDAESWALTQSALLPYLTPTLDFLAALRVAELRRARPAT